jgi:flagellar basal body-associated protein FliL
MLQDYDQTQDTVDADKEDKTPVKKLKTEKTGGQAKKKSHGFAISLCFLSVAALAGSGASYYFALDDQKKSENAKTSLGNAYVLGKTASGLIETNQRQNDSAKKKAKIAQILLGAGAVLLGAGIIFYF